MPVTPSSIFLKVLIIFGIRCLTDPDIERTFQNMPAVIYISDREDRLRAFNLAAGLLFGYSALKAIGQPISLIIPPERLPEERYIIAQINHGEKVAYVETVRTTKDGSNIPISLPFPSS
jgi:PAS domain S-box-containing protein